MASGASLFLPGGIMYKNKKKYYRSKLRGSFVIDNDRNFVLRIARGDNIRWIASYLYVHPGVGANICRRDLLAWRGYELSDQSRGQYAAYFYDFYQTKWYHSKLWKCDYFDGAKKKKMVLTSKGMGTVDLELAKRIAKWDKRPAVRLVVDKNEESTFIGLNYDNIFQEALRF
jgi:hypothetical protein